MKARGFQKLAMNRPAAGKRMLTGLTTVPKVPAAVAPMPKSPASPGMMPGRMPGMMSGRMK